MGLRCASCGYDNDPTRVYCHSCGTRLERGAQAAPAPTGFTHPTDVANMKKPRQPREWGKFFGALFRFALLAALLAAVILALLPPHDLPAPVAPDEMLAGRLSALVATSAEADGTRAFTIPAADINKWLVTSVALKEQPDSLVKLRPERLYAVPGDGDLRVGLEAKLPVGPSLYFEGLFAPVPEGAGSGWQTRRFSVGRLPLPSFAGLLVERQLAGLASELSAPLAQLASASHIGITPETVTLRWSGRQP